MPGVRPQADLDGNPSVLIADASEERRHLMMQYVAIEWPNAAITELESSATALDCAGPRIADFDMLMVGLSGQEAADTGWLDTIRAQAGAPVVVALIEGPQAAAQALLQRGVYCQGRDNMTTAEMRKMLRAALRERLSGAGAPDNTTIIDTGFLTGAAATHPLQRPSLKRVQIRGFQLLRKLGRGGMSEVYLAQNTATRQMCALKVLPGEGVSASVLELFIEECSVVSELDSPYVVRIFEHGVTDECLFVAMEYIQGGDLRERLALGVSAEEATRILQQLARALDVVHRAGIVHGDIKPQNVMFRDAHSLVLVDFGVSRVVETTTVVRAGQVVGTPSYISPEHVLGQPMGGRSDLYSAGVLFFEMLTGHKPFSAGSVDELLRMHVQVPPPRLPRALGAYQELVDRLLAKKPEDRFYCAADLIPYLETAGLARSTHQPTI